MEYPIISDIKIIEQEDGTFMIGRTITKDENSKETQYTIECMDKFKSFVLSKNELDKILLKRNSRTIQTREQQLLLPFKYKVGDIVDFRKPRHPSIKIPKLHGEIIKLGSYQQKDNSEKLVYTIKYTGFDYISRNGGSIKYLASVYENNIIKKYN